MSNQLFLDDMFASLSSFSHERKMAIAFAVYTNLTLHEVIRLQWSDELELNWRAEFILDNVIASETIGNVFWERADNEDRVMNSLPFMFEAMMLWRDWSVFVKQYRLATPIELSVFL